MKFTKAEIAKLLSSTPGVSASKGELLQFFKSPQYDKDEESDGNIIENFLVFRKQLDADLLEGGEYSEKLIEHWSKEMKLETSGHSCNNHDSDGDGYVSCSYMLNGEPHTIECAASFNMQSGCRYPKPVFKNTNVNYNRSK